jgi:hypothetical protein
VEKVDDGVTECGRRGGGDRSWCCFSVDFAAVVTKDGISGVKDYSSVSRVLCTRLDIASVCVYGTLH